MQKIFNRDKQKYIAHAPEKALNILVYRSSFYTSSHTVNEL